MFIFFFWKRSWLDEVSCNFYLNSKERLRTQRNAENKLNLLYLCCATEFVEILISRVNELWIDFGHCSIEITATHKKSNNNTKTIIDEN